jgi:ketosteroid isomerase-like protein
MPSNGERAEVLASVLRALVDGDQASLTRALAHDVTMRAPELSTSTRNDLLEALERRDEAFSDVALDVAPLDVGGSLACAEWTLVMRHSGSIELADGTTIPATGLQIELHGITVAEFLGDQISSLRQYWNVNSLLEQLAQAGSVDAG